MSKETSLCRLGRTIEVMGKPKIASEVESIVKEVLDHIEFTVNNVDVEDVTTNYEIEVSIKRRPRNITHGRPLRI